MDLIQNLNPMQQQGVLQIEGPVLILAGAGSGKTRVLTHRIAYMIQNGIDPFNILAVTFTNKAAKEMKERAAKLSPRGGAVSISTFHSMCVRILKIEIDKLSYDNKFTIYDTDDVERIIKMCIKELRLNDKQYSAKAIMYEISSQKNELVSAKKYAREAESSGDFRLKQIARVYEMYQDRLQKSNSLDFDDIIFKTVELFQNHPEVLRKYQERFKYIMIDEYQDSATRCVVKSYAA